MSCASCSRLWHSTKGWERAQAGGEGGTGSGGQTQEEPEEGEEGRQRPGRGERERYWASAWVLGYPGGLGDT